MRPPGPWACARRASGRVRYGQCLGVPHASAQPSAATASATIASGRDGSAASAAASSMQPSAAISADERRSRDEDLEPLHTSASVSITASVAALRLGALGCSHAIGSVGVAIRARARLDNSTVLASSGVRYAYALVQCACAAAARRGWRQRTSARTAAATHSCAANREWAITARRRACCVGRAIDGVFCKGQSQANKQRNKQTA